MRYEIQIYIQGYMEYGSGHEDISKIKIMYKDEQIKREVKTCMRWKDVAGEIKRYGGDIVDAK